jgi:hypothetical protein
MYTSGKLMTQNTWIMAWLPSQILREQEQRVEMQNV